MTNDCRSGIYYVYLCTLFTNLIGNNQKKWEKNNNNNNNQQNDGYVGISSNRNSKNCVVAKIWFRQQHTNLVRNREKDPLKFSVEFGNAENWQCDYKVIENKDTKKIKRETGRRD